MAKLFVDRPAWRSDADAISTLIYPLLRYRAPVTVDPPPRVFLWPSSHRRQFGLTLTGGQHSYLVARFEDQLIGVLGVRDNRHLLPVVAASTSQGFRMCRCAK